MYVYIALLRTVRIYRIVSRASISFGSLVVDASSPRITKGFHRIVYCREFLERDRYYSVPFVSVGQCRGERDVSRPDKARKGEKSEIVPVENESVPFTDNQTTFMLTRDQTTERSAE